ncbi:Zinc finger LIM-type [Perkinsela sp. CCAP 1560/4]|nr:Zinc finger LIM-type [Perkinsela sp. CCAP 1560/4]|eukprot:KNH07434.1 Zinc finger LIM-type [Perkinsela sp. CCAP 1560/4]
MFRCTPQILIHGKPTKGIAKRTKHSLLWWKNAHPKRLTFKSMKEIEIRPTVQTLNEEVYGRYNLLYDPNKWKMKYSHDHEENHSPHRSMNCVQCKRGVSLDNPRDYLWIPSGRAQVPTQQGYIFHTNCFRCTKCKYRFYANVFASKNGQYYCLHCLRGINPARPIRRWHNPMVSSGRDDSRHVGEIFPRAPHDEDWIFDPDT